MSQKQSTRALQRPQGSAESVISLGRANSTSEFMNALNSPVQQQRHSWNDYNRSTVYSTSQHIHDINGQIDDDNTNKSCFRKCLYNLRHCIPLLHPAGPLLKIWQFFVMILLIYTCIEVPTTIAFRIELNLGQTFGTTAFLIDILLLIDVIINFRTAYFDKWDKLTLIISDTAIAKNYFYGWFFFDIITCIPFQIVNNLHGWYRYKLLFLSLRAIKLIRLFKMIRYVRLFKKQFTDRQFKIMFELFKLICQALLFSHFAACVWWFIGDRTNPSWIDANEYYDKSQDVSYPIRDLTDNFTKYSYAYYWAVVTLFTTGYGDITPTNISEQWIAVICILLGTIFFSYFIGTLTALITEGDKVKLFKDDRLEEAQFFCDQKKLPKELARAVVTHTRYHCDYNYVFDETELVTSLPPQLQHDIQRHLGLNILFQIDFFKEIEPSVLGEMSLRMRSISCNEGYDLYQRDDRAKHIYIQRTGTSICKYYKGNKGKKSRILLKRGTVCGEMALIKPKRRTTVTCQTWSEFYVLSVDDIVVILQSEYPQSWQEKWHSIVGCIKNKMNLIRRVDFNANRAGIEDINDDIFGINAFLNTSSTIHTKGFGGVSSLRTGYDGKVSGNNYKKNKQNNNSIFSQSLKGILNKKKSSDDNIGAVNGSDTDLIDEYDQIILSDTIKRSKSVLPSFLKNRRDSWHRDNAVHHAYQKRNNSLAPILNLENISSIDSKCDDADSPYAVPADTESLTGNDEGDIIAGLNNHNNNDDDINDTLKQQNKNRMNEPDALQSDILSSLNVLKSVKDVNDGKKSDKMTDLKESEAISTTIELTNTNKNDNNDKSKSKSQKQNKSNLLNTRKDIGIEIRTTHNLSNHSYSSSKNIYHSKPKYGKSHSASSKSNISSKNKNKNKSMFRYYSDTKLKLKQLKLETVASEHSIDDDINTRYSTKTKTKNDNNNDIQLKGFNVSEEYQDLQHEETGTMDEETTNNDNNDNMKSVAIDNIEHNRNNTISMSMGFVTNIVDLMDDTSTAL